MKILCIEMQKKGFDNLPMKEVMEMVGWTDYDEKKDVWGVVMSDGSGFECKDQATAQLMSGIEEIKAMMMQKSK